MIVIQKQNLPQGGGTILGKAPIDDLYCRGKGTVTADPPCSRHHHTVLPMEAAPAALARASMLPMVSWALIPQYWGSAHLRSAIREKLWLSRLRACQMRPAWTSQVALRRKSKLTASPSQVIKIHSSWSAMVCIRSPCHHCPTPSSIVCPLVQADTSRAAAPTGSPITPPSKREISDEPRKGSCSSWAPASLVEKDRAAASYRRVADQLSNGIFL